MSLCLLLVRWWYNRYSKAKRSRKDIIALGLDVSLSSIKKDLDDIDSIDSDDTDDLEMEEEPDELYMEDSDDDVSDITEEYKDLVIVDEEDLEQE